MKQAFLLILFQSFLSVLSQFANLTNPYPNILSAQIVITSPTTNGLTSYIQTFTPTIVAAIVPTVAIGISGLSGSSSTALSFKSNIVNNLMDKFTIEIILSGTTSFSYMKFYYIVVHPTIFNTGTYWPVYNTQIQYLDSQLLALNVGYGQRTFQASFNSNSSFDKNHNFACSVYIMGFIGTSNTSFYHIQNQCVFLGTTQCLFKAKVTENTLISKLNIRIFAVDILMMQQKNNFVIQFYSHIFQNGLSSNIIPTYSQSHAVVFLGINSITLNNQNTIYFNYDYFPKSISVPTSYLNKFNIFIFAKSDCSIGPMGSNGTYKCFTGLNEGGCSFSTKQLITLKQILNGRSLFAISNSNKILIVCKGESQTYIQIYRHSGIKYQLVQMILMAGFGCRDIVTNDDLSIFAVIHTYENLFQIYTYNRTTQKYHLKFSQQVDYLYSNYAVKIAFSPDANSIFIVNTIFGSSARNSIMVEYELNMTTLKYQQVQSQTFDGQIKTIKFITNAVSIPTLVIQVTDGHHLYFYRRFNKIYYQKVNKHKIEENLIKVRYYPLWYHPLYCFSGNGLVFAVLTHAFSKDIVIHHYNQTTNNYDKFQSIFLMISSTPSSPTIRLDYEGLTLVINSFDKISYFFLVYKRLSLNQKFILTHIQRTPTLVGQNPPTNFQITKQVIISPDYSANSYKLYIYYCSTSIHLLEQPQNGQNLILNGYNNNLNIKDDYLQKINNAKNQILNKINQNNLQIQKTSQNQKNQMEDKIKAQKEQNNLMNIILFTLLGIQTTILISLILYMFFKKNKINPILNRQNQQPSITKDNQIGQYQQSILKDQSYITMQQLPTIELFSSNSSNLINNNVSGDTNSIQQFSNSKKKKKKRNKKISIQQISSTVQQNQTKI